MNPAPIFEFFNEIGIISQLSSALFSRTMPHGVHVAHFSILNHMVRLGDGRTPVQLASAFQLTKATMTHSLGVLEKAGFVRIEPNPQDGRSKLVHLTAEGRAFREEAIQSVRPGLSADPGKARSGVSEIPDSAPAQGAAGAG